MVSDILRGMIGWIHPSSGKWGSSNQNYNVSLHRSACSVFCLMVCLLKSMRTKQLIKHIVRQPLDCATCVTVECLVLFTIQVYRKQGTIEPNTTGVFKRNVQSNSCGTQWRQKQIYFLYRSTVFHSYRMNPSKWPRMQLKLIVNKYLFPMIFNSIYWP